MISSIMVVINWKLPARLKKKEKIIISKKRGGRGRELIDLLFLLPHSSLKLFSWKEAKKWGWARSFLGGAGIKRVRTEDRDRNKRKEWRDGGDGSHYNSPAVRFQSSAP